MLNILKQLSEQIISPDAFFRKRYAAFQKLLSRDRECHRLLAELEDIYYNARQVDINRVRQLYGKFSAAVAGMLTALMELAPGQYKNLHDYYRKFDFYIRFALAPSKLITAPPYILQVGKNYTNDCLTGGKGLHLSQLSHAIRLPVPRGFIISTSAWNGIVRENNLRSEIDIQLAQADIRDTASLVEISRTLSRYVSQAAIPASLEKEILSSVKKLASEHPDSAFAVRSSAVGEDSTLSFAGQYRSLLCVPRENILDAYRQVLISKYSPSALLYRIVHGLDDEDTPMAVIVLVMVDARVSGVVTTGNPSDSADVSTLVHSVTGLGENLMGGKAVPSTYEIGEIDGERRIIRDTSGKGINDISDSQLGLLADWSRQVSEYYGTPQEIEWSMDKNNNIYLLQARTLNLEVKRDSEFTPDLSGLPLIFKGGITASPGICCGRAFHLSGSLEPANISDDAVLICDVTPPSLVTLLPRLKGVIAREGSVADHFASVAREFRIPFLVQAGEVCRKITEGENITLNAGDLSVYKGQTNLEEYYRRNRMPQSIETPLQRALKMVIDFTSPLNLTDPSSEEFRPEKCRSLHDVIRFSHEKAVQAMFMRSSDSFLRKPKSRHLQTEIPLHLNIIDVGGGIASAGSGKSEITLGDITSLPLQILWKGLSHPNIHWHDHAHYDWQNYDTIALAGGITPKESSSLASFCLISAEYLNVNIRFGYHFTLIDCLCGDTPEENYILLRFAGGGGTSVGKDLRLLFISRVLSRLNFGCEQTGELLDARLMRYSRDDTADRLEHVGRLLGAVCLLDMVLTDEAAIDDMIEKFFREKYDFSHEG